MRINDSVVPNDGVPGQEKEEEVRDLLLRLLRMVAAEVARELKRHKLPEV